MSTTTRRLAGLWTPRRGLVAAVLLVLVAAFVLWYRSEDPRLYRLVDDVRDSPGVTSVEVDSDGLDEVHFSDRATVDEIMEVWERVADSGVDALWVGDVRVDPSEVDVVLPAAVAAAEVHTNSAHLEADEVGRDVWLRVWFGRAPEGADPPTPADGARHVIRLLEALDPDDLPDDLDLVEAHRAGEQVDLVSVDRAALERLPDTIEELRWAAAKDPARRIACDAEGCRPV